MAEPSADPTRWIPWDVTPDPPSSENRDQRKNSDGFEGEQLEVILSESDEGIELPTHQVQNNNRKENTKPIQEADTFMHSLQALSQDDLRHQVLGRLAPIDQLFCPYSAVSKYPYKYMKGIASEEVSQAFFANGQFKARGWTVYYIHTLLPSYKRPLLLLLAIEVQAFFSEINKQLGLYLSFPSSHDHRGFLLKFSQDHSPRPRYLGRLTTENTLEMMEAQIPGSDFKEPGESDLDPRSFHAFRRKMEAAIQAGRKKAKASKDKKKKSRIAEKRSCCAQLKRVQFYLGIKPRWRALDDPHSIPGLNWSELQEAIKKHESAKIKSKLSIDTTKPAPHDLYKNVVFICIDVESYERHHKTITEVGISTLDTYDIIDLAPGEGGEAWMKKIRARHFRIKEHSHLKNTDFISGCADKFEKDFGVSEWISIQEAPEIIASCFRPPFSDPDSINLSANDNELDIHAIPDDNCLENTPADQPDALPKRNIVLVGHDIKSDIEYLQILGYNVNNLSNLTERIDTVDLFRALKREQQGTNLGSVLLDLGLVGWNLHNAGNDAVYTLQAMIGIAFKALAERRDRQAALTAACESRKDQAAKEAEERIAEDYEEWDLADNDNGGEFGDEPVEVSKQHTSHEISKLEIQSSKINVAEQPESESCERKIVDEKEATRLAFVVGEDLGEGETEGVVVNEVNLGEIRDSVMKWKGIEETSDGGSPVSMGIHSDIEQTLQAHDGLGTPGSISVDEGDTSPIPAHVSDRLAFFERFDSEDGGVKL